jgi:hypothetical protein
LQNGLFGDLKMLTHLLLSYCVIKKFEIWVPCNVPSLNLIPNLSTHLEFKIKSYLCKMAASLKASNTMFLLSSYHPFPTVVLVL